MNSDSFPQDGQRFIDALSSSLESLGLAKDLVFRYLEDRQLMPFRDGKPPSIEQIDSALRDLLGSGTDAIIHSLKEKLRSGGMKVLLPVTGPLLAYTSCLFGCTGLICCGLLEVCKLGMASTM